MEQSEFLKSKNNEYMLYTELKRNRKQAVIAEQQFTDFLKSTHHAFDPLLPDFMLSDAESQMNKIIKNYKKLENKIMINVLLPCMELNADYNKKISTQDLFDEWEKMWDKYVEQNAIKQNCSKNELNKFLTNAPDILDKYQQAFEASVNAPIKYFYKNMLNKTTTATKREQGILPHKRNVRPKKQSTKQPSNIKQQRARIIKQLEEQNAITNSNNQIQM